MLSGQSANKSPGTSPGLQIKTLSNTFIFLVIPKYILINKIIKNGLNYEIVSPNDYGLILYSPINRILASRIKRAVDRLGLLSVVCDEGISGISRWSLPWQDYTKMLAVLPYRRYPTVKLHQQSSSYISPAGHLVPRKPGMHSDWRSLGGAAPLRGHSHNPPATNLSLVV